jgi:hypothetical protein
MEHQVQKETWMSGYILPAITAILFLSLCVVALYRYYQTAQVVGDQIIVDHVGQLEQIFKKIDATCQIIGFEHEKSYVDFLTVRSFVGSEVGAMNLAHAEKWEGPYLQDNPTIYEKQYLIVDTPKGYYLVPGDGVVLSNGKIIGKDLIFNRETNFEALLTDPSAPLMFEGKPLVALIKKK